MNATATAPEREALLEVEHLELHFPIKRGPLGRTVGRLHAVDDVTFTLSEGETLGLVGESGCGKTTLARAVMRLIEPTAGTIRFRGDDVSHSRGRALRPLRREMQMVFQDPNTSLNPRKRVGQIVGMALRLHGATAGDADRRVRELLQRVGLSPEHVNRFPHEFSGGQRQRIGVARALAVAPKLIVLDEPVSALDVSIQAQIINLLDELQADLGLTYLFIAHDLSVVRHVSDRIAVMYRGKLMEVAPAQGLYDEPIHPYTAALLEAIPPPDPRANRSRRRSAIPGEPLNPAAPLAGCVFHPRCPNATDVCRAVEPPLVSYANGHVAACHHPRSVSPQESAPAPHDPAPQHPAPEQPPGRTPPLGAGRRQDPV